MCVDAFYAYMSLYKRLQYFSYQRAAKAQGNPCTDPEGGGQGIWTTTPEKITKI